MIDAFGEQPNVEDILALRRFFFGQQIEQQGCKARALHFLCGKRVARAEATATADVGE